MIDWGNVPGWVAVLAAATAAVFAALAWTRERRRDEAKESNERKVQAEKVGAWLHQNKPEFGPSAYVVWYRNSSGLPVYNVNLQVLSQRDNYVYWERTYKLLEPNDSPQELEIEHPSASALIDVDAGREFVHKDGKWVGVELVFRDSSGVHWRRDVFGVLTELPDSTTA